MVHAFICAVPGRGPAELFINRNDLLRQTEFGDLEESFLGPEVEDIFRKRWEEEPELRVSNLSRLFADRESRGERTIPCILPEFIDIDIDGGLPLPVLHVGSPVVSSWFGIKGYDWSSVDGFTWDLPPIHFVSCDAPDTAGLSSLAASTISDAASRHSLYVHQSRQDAGPGNDGQALLDLYYAGMVDPVENLASQLARRASEILGDLIEGAPALELEMPRQEFWYMGKRPNWIAIDRWTGARLRLIDLGDAHRRWVDVAVRLACIEVQAPTDQANQRTVLLIDEPERALHPTAVARLTRELARLADVVFAATHSPIVIGQAHRVLHAEREPWLSLKRFPGLRTTGKAPDRLGMLGSDQLAATRTLLLVEGKHDEVVLNALLSGLVDDHGHLIFSTFGHKTMAAAFEGLFLLTFSESELIFVVDNARQKLLDSSMTLARGRKRLQSQPGKRSPEEATLLKIIDSAQSLGCVDRVQVVGLDVHDISELLPPSYLARPEIVAEESWMDLREGFLVQACRDRFMAGDGVKYKNYLRGRGYDVTTSGLKRAATRLSSEWSAAMAEGRHLEDLAPSVVPRLVNLLRNGVERP